MIRPPFLARVAAGLAVTAYEETLKLPSTAVALPMTTVSQILQTTMRMQQVMTSLAIKGDQFFEIIGAAPEETAEWATFDEDEPAVTPARPVTTDANTSAPGRFALYSIPPETDVASTPSAATPPVPKVAKPPTPTPAAPKSTAPKSTAAKNTAAKSTASKKTAAKSAAKKTAPAKSAPQAATTPVGSVGKGEIVEYLDYDSLTLAQLRARLRTLSVDELTALLDYEKSHAARPPFVTMLSNRITTARNK